MVENNSDSLIKTRKELEDLKLKMIDAYLKQIRENYTRANTTSQKEHLFSRVEALALDEEFSSPFDCAQAFQIREREGFTLKSLGQKVGLSQQSISNYELGKTNPRKYKKYTEAYVQWLIDYGYKE